LRRVATHRTLRRARVVADARHSFEDGSRVREITNGGVLHVAQPPAPRTEATSSIALKGSLRRETLLSRLVIWAVIDA
jgi:hypothetical protein